MKKTLLALPVAVLTAVAVQGAVFQFSASLSGAAESPSNGSPGTGAAAISYDETLHTLTVSILFSGLTGTTTASHIHAATALALTGNAGVATTTPTFSGFPSGVSSGSYSSTLDLTQSGSFNPAYITANGGTVAAAEAALVSALKSNTAYVNIHSSLFPSGEIRGFITAVPEPGETCVAVGGALGAFALYRRVRARRSK